MVDGDSIVVSWASVNDDDNSSNPMVAVDNGVRTSWDTKRTKER